jgi:spore maturation protein CgeD
LVSHDKPKTLKKAIQSVLDQTHQDWNLILIDSGVLIDKDYFHDITDERILLVKSEETPELQKTKNMASWCYNKALRSGVCDGDLIVYLCDDDYFYETAFETFSTFFENNKSFMAAYASIDLSMLSDGEDFVYGERKALEICGEGTYKMDCRVDYLQFCHKLEILNMLDHSEWWSESKNNQSHADGLFMESVAEKTLVYPIFKKIGRNRRTKESVNFPC